MTTLTVQQAFELASQHLFSGRLAEAEALCRQILATLPDHADTLHLLGIVAFQCGQLEAALGIFRQTIARGVAVADYHNSLGSTLSELGRFEEAIPAFHEALRLRPDHPEAHSNLGDALRQLGQSAAAVAACRRALELRPDFATALNNLGGALRELGDIDGAIAALRQAIALQPDYAEAHNNLGVALMGRFDVEPAVAAYRAALRIQPHLASAHQNLGSALADLGEWEEAMACFRATMALAPGDATTHGALLYNLQFLPRLDPREAAAERARWNERHARPLAAAILPHTNAPDPARRLRIGYVSPDFREHPVVFFLTGLLAAHDRAQVEVHCYASVQRADAHTARLRAHADVWHDVAAFSDARLAEKIRANEIDILVDLSMHSAGNRLLTFARKPAPVQLSWLAYPGTTGLETIDYRLTDSAMEPAGLDAPAGSERPLRLPDAWCCYEPPRDAFPEVGALPAAQAGHVTFGSLNKFSRLNDDVLRCWARLGQAVPDARWLIVCPEGRCRARILRLFAEGGIAEERVDFVSHRPWVEYMRLFARIDLCLDTFPCNGMTATCHALWMGAPVITLAGAEPVSRVGASLLSTIGLRELVAHSEGEYVRLATALASDLPRLAALRAGMRERMEHSPLMDAPRFARHVEAAYRAIWREWCGKSEA